MHTHGHIHTDTPTNIYSKTYAHSETPDSPHPHSYTDTRPHPQACRRSLESNVAAVLQGFPLSIWDIFLRPVVPGSLPVTSIPVAGTTPLASGSSWFSFQLWKANVDANTPERRELSPGLRGSALLLGQSS